jgi:hypothetical protein
MEPQIVTDVRFYFHLVFVFMIEHPLGKRVRACGRRKVEIFPYIWHPAGRKKQ